MENLYLNTLLFRFPEAQDNTPENFHEAKAKYNKLIFDFFRQRNFITDCNFVKDTEVYVYSHQEHYGNYNFDVYDRYCLKINYNQILSQPELVVSYERTMRVLTTSIAQLSTDTAKNNEYLDTPLKASNPLSNIHKVVERYAEDEMHEHLRILDLKRIQDKIRKSDNAKPLNYEYLYPVINQELQIYFGIPFNQADEDAQFKPINKYKRYLEKINTFIQTHLLKADFQKFLPISKDFTPTQAGQMPMSAMQLKFANNVEQRIPQRGLNFGTYQQPTATNITLFYIYPNTITKAELIQLNNNLTISYGNPNYYPFTGLRKYIGVETQQYPKLSICYNTQSPTVTDDIERELENRSSILTSDNTTFICCFLSTVNKEDIASPLHILYYRLKEMLLRRGIVSQCFDIAKMRTMLQTDQQRGRDNFKYTLQNMSVAICAKLGGTPWILSIPTERELVIGIGAFRQGKRQYIGVAFVFQNNGTFNEYTYFSKHDIIVLAGAIEEKIVEYTKIYHPPKKLIIHYYKRMKEKDAQHITDTLNQLQLDIPVYVLTINETESESVFVFDKANPELLPYSGRYISLGNNDYLMCNNTRYDNSDSRPDSYPFPVKIHIHCNDADALQLCTIQQLLQQVYQFSRIYYKSVKQQNLPVSILYPKMISEIMSRFIQQGAANNVNNCLWFL